MALYFYKIDNLSERIEQLHLENFCLLLFCYSAGGQEYRLNIPFLFCRIEGHFNMGLLYKQLKENRCIIDNSSTDQPSIEAFRNHTDKYHQSTVLQTW